MRDRKIALANNLTEIDYCNPLIKKNSKNKIPISSLINQNIEIDVVKGKKTLDELERDPGRDRENLGNTSPVAIKKDQQIVMRYHKKMLKRQAKTALKEISSDEEIIDINSDKTSSSASPKNKKSSSASPPKKKSKSKKSKSKKNKLGKSGEDFNAIEEKSENDSLEKDVSNDSDDNSENGISDSSKNFKKGKKKKKLRIQIHESMHQLSGHNSPDGSQASPVKKYKSSTHKNEVKETGDTNKTSYQKKFSVLKKEGNVLSEALPHYNLRQAFGESPIQSQQSQRAKKQMLKQLPKLSKIQEEKDANEQNQGDSENYQNNLDLFTNLVTENEENYLLSIVQNYLNEQKTLYFFEDFTLENIVVIIKAVQLVKMKYQKTMNAVSSFIQGLRSFLRFKIGNTKKFTKADKKQNTETYENKVSEGNKWIEIYKDFCQPNLKKSPSKLYSSIFDDGVSPLKQKNTIKNIELQRLNSTLDMKYSQMKDAKRDINIKLEKRTTQNEVRLIKTDHGKSEDGNGRVKIQDPQNHQIVKLIRDRHKPVDDAIVSVSQKNFKQDLQKNKIFSDKNCNTKVFSGSSFQTKNNNVGFHTQRVSSEQNILPVKDNFQQLDNFQHGHSKNFIKYNALNQKMPVITLESIKNISTKSVMDEKIFRPVGLSSEKGYKSYATKYSLNNTFKDIHAKAPLSNRTPKLTNINREKQQKLQSMDDIPITKGFLAKKFARDPDSQQIISAHREMKEEIDAIKGHTSMGRQIDSIREYDKS